MAVNTILKDELRDVLGALLLAATAANQPAPFMEGYLLALTAVATAYGLELPARPEVTIEHERR